MTRDKLNRLRSDSQVTRDLYYLLRDNVERGTGLYGPEDVEATYRIWKNCQRKAEEAVLEWIGQDCKDSGARMTYGPGKVTINGKIVGNFEGITFYAALDNLLKNG